VNRSFFLHLVAPVVCFVDLSVSVGMAQSPPTVLRSPTNRTLSLGDRTTWTASIGGSTPRTLQWTRDGVELPGATNLTLTLTGLTLNDAGVYALGASNSVGTTSTVPARLIVDTRFTLLATSAVMADRGVGMSWADYDNDGFIDLFCGGSDRNQLYRNDGRGQLERQPRENPLVGRNRGADNVFAGYWADQNADGHMDLFVPTGFFPTSERNQFFRGEVGGGWTVVTNGPLATDSTASLSAAWADFDRDGQMDLFLSNWRTDSAPEANFLYRAQHDGGFVRLRAPGFPEDRARNYGAAAADFNGDGFPDVAVAVNPGGRTVLYENVGGTRFTRRSVDDFGDVPGAGGVGWADFDNDGDLDLFVAWALRRCRLLRNDGNGTFTPLTNLAPTVQPGRANGGAWGDFDNDGHLDLFVPRLDLYLRDGDKNDSLFRNLGDGTFERVAAGSLEADGADSWGAAWGDIDNDGALDLAVGCVSYSGGAERNRLYKNNGSTNGWLMLRLLGTQSNRDVLGARVWLTATIRGRRFTQYREVGTGAVWCQNDPRPHFGLGDAVLAEEVRIVWPTGAMSILRDVPGRQIVAIREPPWLRLTVLGQATNLVLRASGPRAGVVALEQATDLASWREIQRRTLAAGAAEFDVSVTGPAGFFRARIE
jgi:enediyne biosynthesis protein E4